MSIKSARPSNHLILYHPLLLPSVFPSIRVFSNELSLCIRWPKYWSFSISISLFSEYSGLISFGIDIICECVCVCVCIYIYIHIYIYIYIWASLIAQSVKNLSAMQETQVRSLGGEDPLDKGMATHSSILAWRIPWTEEPGGLRSIGLQKVVHDWATNTHSCVCVCIYMIYACRNYTNRT